MTSSSLRKRKKRLRILKNKRVLLGITGGIAAYKSIDLARRLGDEGASVVVAMTEAAKQFVTPLSLEVASQNKVYTSLFDEPMAHISLPSSADVMVIAPATADIIAKFAHGIADDLLSTCFLSYSGKVVIAPSMNWRMYENRIFGENLRKLLSTGVVQVGPERGDLACGEEGIGRMAEPAEIVETVMSALTEKDLAGEKMVITAGPTREYLDPVRFISNRSSGKMGYALARAARDRGASVILISGPSYLKKPQGVGFVGVETSAQMMKSVKQSVQGDTTVLVMAAAVADFSPAVTSRTKIEKTGDLNIPFRQTEDIISSVLGAGKRPYIIGFAAETGNNIARAQKKMKVKNMDMVVFNDVTEAGAGFDVDTNKVVIIDRKGKTRLEVMSKDSVADAIFDRFIEIKA
ncbi:fused 4'-phosphopantothenoylcysteine decarboxylase; phosphopantothenoylcysteine synthetase, FMN-binding [Candidatus Sulfobium mesophilum]|uniref:Coenzyme A biosynthesis bifunctional protein CoaBC n=1 Tax=Candidatus Sulfobium mesophilum TaxID=2016548 RepID=A0A2U3QLB1_9BACT|nr:fused 4'-phosphopantothenoylcysteine decarboxylase; phosphopantothenoylcysteine synthetase, FMN-binding [Candidatus Sulfobium mesophilum]